MRGKAVAAILAFAFAATSAAEVGAATVSGLSTSLRQARETAARLAARSWDNAAEERLVDTLDALADDFHALAADGASMPKTAAALLALLDSTRTRYTDVLEAMQAEVIRVDGDLEAAQDSAAWQERELLAMRLQYRLNWVRYETAMRYETSPSARKRLLTQAHTGFADFLGSGDAELTVESLLGHGLTAKALRRYDDAISDFRAALDMKPDAEMAARLRAPLAESLLTRERYDEALAVSSQLLAGARRGELRSQALFLRAKALLLSIRKRGELWGAAKRKSMRTEAAKVLEELYGRGSYWKSKVVQLVDSGVETPEAWMAISSSGFVTWLIADSLRRRGDCDQAQTLYDQLVENDAFVIESRYGRGSCAYREGRYAAAIEELEAYFAVAAAGDANYHQAAYLRFKAAESLYLQEDIDPEGAGIRYVRMLEDFLAKAPEHERAFEAWFRLGEWHRDQASFVECGDAFAKVSGEAAFEIKAAFLSGQCYVEAVLAVPDSEPAPAQMVVRAIEALDRFVADAERFGADGDADRAALVGPLAAKATVMAAAIAPRADGGDMTERIQRLEGFEQRFANQRDLLPEVHSLRIVAYRTLGEVDAAGQELERLLAIEGSATYQHESLKKLGIVFLKEAADRDEAGDSAGAARSRRVALRVYERLLEDARNGTVEGSLDAIEALVTDLRSRVEPS